jgi:polar amino acid transport system substrate-binding protein
MSTARLGTFASLVLAGALGLSGPVGAEEPPGLGAPGEPTTLEFCFEETPALPWRSRQKVGLYFELLDEVARRLGLRFNYSPQPWRHCLDEVAAGRMDGAFAVALSPERRVAFVFPPGAPSVEADVLRVDTVVLVRRRDTPIDVREGHLVGTDKPVGVLPAYAVGDDLQRMGWAIDTASRDHLHQLSRLSRGELDVIALGGFRWAQLSAVGGPALESLEALPAPLMTKYHFLGLSHQLAEAHPGLAQRLWATTREVRSSATFRRREQAAIAEALAPRTP